MGRAVTGKIIAPPKANIRAHERKTAETLAQAGYVVEFVLASPVDNTRTPDILMNGKRWEIKSRTTSKLRQIEFNLIKASRQSENIIIDGQRIKHLPDKKVQAFLLVKLQERKSIQRLLYINKHRKVIDINTLV